MIKGGDGETEISFLRRLAQQNKFTYPQVPDICSVQNSDISAILPKPIYFGQTRRQHAYLTFHVNFDNLEVR